MSADDDAPVPRPPSPNEERLDSLFARLQPLSAEEREALIEHECADAPVLAARLRALLAPGAPTDFLVPPAAGASAERFFGGGMEGRTLGDFELVREIGRGSMGVVYLAEQQNPRRTVALKILPAAHAQDPLRAARFRREAEAASHVDHPNAVPILAFGDAKGQLWFAMRYVDGHDLHEELDRHRRLRAGQPTPLPFLPTYDGHDYVPRALERFCELLDALQNAHDHQVVHRDVKPQNVLVDREGRFHLADFGLAKDERFGTLTETKAVQGTPHYMSPEQARVLEAKIDHRTDVYSAAVVLYELLSLQRAFPGSTQQEVFEKIGTREPTPLTRIARRVPRDLEVVCAKGMAKRPERRYASAREFADDLRRFLRHEAILARPPSALERAGRFVERHRKVVLTGSIAVALVSFVAWFVQDQQFRTVLAAEETRFSQVLAYEDWTDRVLELVATRQRLADLRASGRRFPAEFEQQAGRLERRFEQYKQDELARANALIDRGLAGETYARPPGLLQPEEVGTPFVPDVLRTGRDPVLLQQGLRILQDLAALFSDDPRVVAGFEVDRIHPRLTVELPRAVLESAPRSNEARAWIQRLDPVTETIDPPRALGLLPLHDVPLAPDLYRIVVEIPDYGWGEYQRHLGVGPTRVNVQAWVRRTSEIVASMRRIEGGRFTYKTPGLTKGGMGCSEVHSEVELAPYWIGEAAVSNAEVVRYLRETGARVPMLWYECGYRSSPEDLMPDAREREAWLDLPATGFDGNFARDFAEWSGARLPLHPELERAKRGADTRFFPWGDDRAAAGGVRFHLDGEAKSNDRGLARFRNYLRGVLPVRAPDYLQPPENLYHSFGNVMEWTDSPMPESRDGFLYTSPYERIVMGPAWWAVSSKVTLCNHNIRGIDDRYATWDVGIRLAKSVRP
ncbi:MAG: protein kinase [Planctomycetes bacterium]|nr:protein kinase [Planctomycetota bacterium]